MEEQITEILKWHNILKVQSDTGSVQGCIVLSHVHYSISACDI